MFFLAFLTTGLATEIVDGQYPGGASASDPVPTNLAQYTTPYGYGLFALIVFIALLFFVTRFKVER